MQEKLENNPSYLFADNNVFYTDGEGQVNVGPTPLPPSATPIPLGNYFIWSFLSIENKFVYFCIFEQIALIQTIYTKAPMTLTFVLETVQAAMGTTCVKIQKQKVLKTS